MAERIRLLRPGDLLVGSVDFENLVVASDGSALVRVTPGVEAFVHFRLPAQHHLEPAVTAEVDGFLGLFGLSEPPTFVVPLVASGGALFAFKVPDELDRVELATPSGLFDALATFKTLPGGMTFDAIAELSFGGIELDWVLPPSPLSIDEESRHPLWRIRPDVPHGSSFPAGLNLHIPVPQVDVALATSSGVDHQLGRDLLQEAGFTGLAGTTISVSKYFMRRFLARDFTGTPLGGTVSLFGPVPGPTPAADDFAYEHRTSLGRDVSVRDTQWGWLSSGHRAAITTIAQRVIRGAQILDVGGSPTSSTTATMLARAELVVTEPVLDLSAHAGEYANGGREIPFTSLVINTQRHIVDIAVDEGLTRVITRGGAAIHFDLTGMDHLGRAVELRMPLAFLPDGRPASDLAGLMPVDGTQASVAAAPIALAPEAGRAPGSTSITVAGLGVNAVPGVSRPVLPRVDSLLVGIDALTGISEQPPMVTASLHPSFLAQGLDRGSNPVGALLALPAMSLDLPTASVGGVGNPGGVVDLISAEKGAVSSAIALTPPSLDQIATAFPLPKLLGTIDLLKLMDTGSFPVVDGLPSVPQLARTGSPGEETLTYHFEAKLVRSVPEIGISVEPNAKLVLDSRITRSGTAAPTVTSNGSVTGITFELAGIIRLRFERIRFATDAGGKTTVDIDGVEVDFLGAFEFLAEIARVLAGFTGGSGPRVDVDSNGVTAGFQLAIPNLAMGIMQLTNLSIAAFLRIPLDAGPLSFTLDVAKRERPFQATVSMFGGGGFLSLEVTPDGLRRLEASIEFGGSMSLDIIVASGGVSVMAGIYFGLKIEEIDGRRVQSLDLAAFVRASGHLTVLGIVSIFVEFRLALTYKEVTVGGSSHAMLAGTASVTVGVKVLFFSKSVSLTVTREFIGSASDPSFVDCFDEEDWSDYCLAFAGSGPPALPSDPFGGGMV
jgi:hypothetical protein